PLVDVLTFSAASSEGEDGETVEGVWPVLSSGGYARVVAHGTIYGPLAEPPTEADEVPADAPVHGTATVTTTAEDGPNVTYTAIADAPVSGAGYYVWVWEIAYADQPTTTRLRLPDDYSWADRFGLAAETHLAPPSLT